MKADGKIAVSVTIEPDLLAQIDVQAKALDVTRSQYLRRLARQDLAKAKTEAEPAQPQPQEEAA